MEMPQTIWLDETPPPPQPAFTQRVKNEYPPNWREVVTVFPNADRPGVIFSWGDVIYNPSGGPIHPALRVHEAVHGERQGTSPFSITTWWDYYLTDAGFRFYEERLAHIEEYRYWYTNYPRNARRAALSGIAARLASPLYGNLITKEAAKALLRHAVRN